MSITTSITTLAAATSSPMANATETTLSPDGPEGTYGTTMDVNSPHLDITTGPDGSDNRAADIMRGWFYSIGSIGIIGNLFVVVVMMMSRSMRKRLANVFITNQSLLDGMSAVFLVATSTISSDDVPYSGVHGVVYCKLWLSKLSLWGLLVSSTYNLMSLTLERYMAVVHPIWHKVFFTRSKATVLLVFPWVFGILYNSAYMIPTSIVQDQICLKYYDWPSDIVRKAFGILTVIVQYFLPLGLQVYCYARILLVIKNRSKVQPSPAMVSPQVVQPSMQLAVPNSQGVPQGAPTVPENRDDRWTRAHRNTLKTAALVSLSFVVCWSWNQVLYTMFNLGFPEDYNSTFYNFTVIAVFMNCCVNPFIYALQYEQFKRAACKLIFKNSSQTGNHVSVHTAQTNS